MIVNWFGGCGGHHWGDWEPSRWGYRSEVKTEFGQKDSFGKLRWGSGKYGVQRRVRKLLVIEKRYHRECEDCGETETEWRVIDEQVLTEGIHNHAVDYE